MNNDLISRSALLKKAVKPFPDALSSMVSSWDIAHAPAVDAVVPVRCGLCKHWDVEGLYCHHPAGLSYCGKTGAAKGFCCFGDRRADDGHFD